MLALLAAGAGAQPPICTDRPTKANAVCTVPAGAVQVESSAIGWTRADAGGARLDQLVLGATFLKLGIDPQSDLQVGFTPYTQTILSSAGARDRLSGFGDTVVRYKRRLTADDAKVQVALIPFIKLPTAERGIGNRKVEAGLAVPVSVAAGAATVTFGPELDLLADRDGSGRHPALVNLANVAVPVTRRLTVVGEVWTNFNFDPAGTVRQASLDGAVAYALSPRSQIDLGANVGLTRETADIELYAGVSLRI